MVDPDDDSIRRFVALHYKYDPERRERRHVFVAAFDNEREFQQFIRTRGAELRARQELGEAEECEHINGVTHEPGHKAQSQRERLVDRALKHGVPPQDVVDPATVEGLFRSRTRWFRRRG